MTVYETMTLVISIIAVVTSIGIPLTGYLYRKFQKPRLKIYEFEHQPLTIICTRASSQIKLSFSVSCQNARCVIRSIEACIASESSGESTELYWTTLEPIHMNWANGMGSTINLNTMTLAHPLLLEAESLTPLSVHFEPCGEMTPQSWLSGRYRLTVKLFYDADKNFEQSFRFSLNAEEAARLHLSAMRLASPSCEQTKDPHLAFITKNFDEGTL